MALLVGNGVVADPLGDDIQFALVEFDLMAIHLDSQPALQDEEELVFMVVSVPGQRAVDLGDLHIGIVDFGHHAGRPEFGERLGGASQGRD